MVFIEKWGAFESQAKALMTSKPAKTRYVLKYTPGKQLVCVKVTDDVVCLQYKTDQDADIKRITRLVKWFGDHVASIECQPAAASAGSA